MIYKKDLVSGAILVAMSIFYFIEAFNVRVFGAFAKSAVNSGTLPKIWGICLLILGAIILLRGIKGFNKAKKSGGTETKQPGNVFEENFPVIGTLVLVGLYILVLEDIGFIISTAVYLFFQILLLTVPEKRKPLFTAVLSIVFSFTTYLLFVKALSVVLPGGILEI